MMNEDKYIRLLGVDGKKLLAEDIFTFEDKQKNYVLIKLPTEYNNGSVDLQFSILAYKYEKLEDGSIGKLIEIDETATEEWVVVEEKLLYCVECVF